MLRPTFSAERLSLKNAAGANVTLTLGQAGTTDTFANLATTLASDGFTVANSGGIGGSATLTITTANSNQSAITAASLTDTTAGTLTYTPAAAYYTVGVSTPVIGTIPNGLGIADAATGQAADATFTSDTNGKGGIATISYSDSAGQSLSATDLTNQANASCLDLAEHGHRRRGGAGRLHRRANQHAERRQPGAQHAAGKRAVGAKRSAGYRLCVRNLQHVEVRDPEPDRHLGSGAGQQHAAGSDQAACNNRAPRRWIFAAGVELTGAPAADRRHWGWNERGAMPPTERGCPEGALLCDRRFA